MTSKDSKPTKALINTPAVEPLPSNISQIYTYVHPLLVLTAFTLRFSATVADPVYSLTALLGVTWLLQIQYAILCLPTSASGVRPSMSQLSPKSPQQQRKKPATAKSSSSLTTKIIPAVLSTLLSLVLGTPLITALLILHGAPLTTHHLQTILTGAHLSLLATVPLFYSHGVASARWRELVSMTAPVDEIVGAAMGTLVGAWVGAVPIPLDWDREWQKWPVTVVAGAYGGWAVGKLLGGTLCKGWRVRWDDKDGRPAEMEKNKVK